MSRVQRRMDAQGARVMNKKLVGLLMDAKKRGIAEENFIDLKKARLITWSAASRCYEWNAAGYAALAQLEREMNGVPFGTPLIMAPTPDPWTRAMLSGARASRTSDAVSGCVIDGVLWVTDGHIIVRMDTEIPHFNLIPQEHIRSIVESIDVAAPPSRIEKLLLRKTITDEIRRGDDYRYYNPLYYAVIGGRSIYNYHILRAVQCTWKQSVLVLGTDHRKPVVGMVCDNEVVAVVPGHEIYAGGERT